MGKVLIWLYRKKTWCWKCLFLRFRHSARHDWRYYFRENEAWTTSQRLGVKQIQRLKARLATCIYRGERCPWLQDSSCSCSKRNCAGVQGIVDNPSDDSRIFLLILLLCEPNALVFEDIVGPVQYAFSIDNLVCRLTFFSDDEESPEHVDAIESGEVKIYFNNTYLYSLSTKFYITLCILIC